MLDERAHGERGDPAALLVLGEPVADARGAMAPVDAVEADRPDQRAVADDRGLQAVVVADLAAGGPDEGERGRHVLLGGPRHPARDVRAVDGHERVEGLGVGLLEQPQPAVGRQLMVQQHRRIVA